MLFELGLEPGSCPEAVALSQPDVLSDIARQYFEAGAEIVETNTFGGSPLKLSQYDLDGKTEEINQRAVQAVREVVDHRAYVGACVGPSGKILEPYGDVGEAEVYDSYLRQMKALVGAGIDLVLVETMLDIIVYRIPSAAGYRIMCMVLKQEIVGFIKRKIRVR